MLSKRQFVNFSRVEDIDVIVMAQLGRSTKAIQARTGLSAGQIQYRLTKAKKQDNLPVGIGYRVQWRDGTSALARRVDALMFRQLEDKVRSRMRGAINPKALPAA